MNIQERVEKYRRRGFQKTEAEILVLIEEAAIGLFSAYQNQFIMIGGAAFVMFHDSPRLSRDLDLLARIERMPSPEEIQKVIESSVQPTAEVLGVGRINCQQQITADFTRIWVEANQKTLFSVDLTRKGGSVLTSEIVQERIAGADEQIVIAPSANFLLFQKCETFLSRRHIKSRDAFDIDLLVRRGAKLDEILRAHLHDFIQMHELDAETIRERIKSVSAKLCTAELRHVLPDRLFQELAGDEFRQLRQSLESVLKDWIKEGP